MREKLNTILLIVVVLLFMSPVNAETPSKVTVKECIVKHSIEMGMDPALALSIAKLESDFNHSRRSPYGAVGVFQLLPSTAQRMGYNAHQLNGNVKGGIAYYKLMYNMFGSVELALAAYNAGPGNVSKYNGVPPFGETKAFVNRIMQEYNYQKANPDPIINKVKNLDNKSQEKVVKSEQSNILPSVMNAPKVNDINKKDVKLPENILSIYVKSEQI